MDMDINFSHIKYKYYKYNVNINPKCLSIYLGNSSYQKLKRKDHDKKK